MKKQIDFFLTSVDEHELSLRIKEAFPDVVFVDDTRWDTMIPREVVSVDQAGSELVLIWNRAIVPKLPLAIRPDNRYQAPIAGTVLLLIRSRIRDGVIKSGSLMAGIDDSEIEMIAFAKCVFKILRRVATYRAAAVDKSTGTVLNDKVPSAVVGPDAARWCDEHPDRFMMFANSPYCFLRPLAPRKRARS